MSKKVTPASYGYNRTLCETWDDFMRRTWELKRRIADDIRSGSLRWAEAGQLYADIGNIWLDQVREAARNSSE